MKKIAKFHLTLPSILLLGMICLVQTNGWASPFRPSPHHISRRDPGIHYHHTLPIGYVALRLTDAMYYYAEGFYYRHTPSGYVVVPAPVGAEIQILPPRYKTIIYEGTPYYLVSQFCQRG